MIRNWYNQIPHPVLKTKREITKYINWQQFTKGTRGKPNEQLFPKQVLIQLPKIYKYVTNIIAEPKYKYGQQEQVTVRNHNRSTAHYKVNPIIKDEMRWPEKLYEMTRTKNVTRCPCTRWFWRDKSRNENGTLLACLAPV